MAALTLATSGSPLGALTAAVRPEYRLSVLVPPRDNRLFNNGPCQVTGCRHTAWSRRDLCGTHTIRWFHARQAGADRDEWIATASPLTTPQSCIVDGCNFGRSRHGLCGAHSRRWARDEPARRTTDWARTAAPLPLASTPARCSLPGCDLWCHSRSQFCVSDNARWTDFRKRQPGAGVADFLTYVQRSSIPVIDVSELPPRITLEVQYIFQCWVERGTKRTDAYAWTRALGVLRDSGATSMLDLAPEDWVRRLPGTTGLCNYSATVFRWGWVQLDVLLNGTGWERQYPLDEWQLAQIGHPKHPKRTLKFAPVTQPWLRDLAKRWIRHRLAVGLAVTTVGGDLMALHHLSDSLDRVPDTPTGPAQFSRHHVEACLAASLTRYHNDSSRVAVINSIRTFLRDVHQFEWAPTLPASTMVHRDDYPRHTRLMPARAISEFVMAQIESPTRLATMPDPANRLVLELMIRCGLRAVDAVDLALDCLVDDGAGHPYLHYLNHKMKRDAYVPIDDEFAGRVRQQRAEVEARFSAGTASKLFPGRFSNIDGTRSLTAGGFRHAFGQWLTRLNLTDEHGNQVKVTPHQFRHTFGTRLINQDVPQHIVQKLMDHVSPEMTNHYARLHDKTLRAAWAKARKINAEGSEVQLGDDHPLADTQWLRAGIARAKQTLPNGFCGMPIQSDCEHANPCLSCPLFITTSAFLPQHEAQLRATLTLIDQSDAAGHGRIAAKNRQIATNLNRIITACQQCDPGQAVVGGRQTENEPSSEFHAG